MKFEVVFVVAEALLITRSAVPLFDTVNVLVAVAPVATEPKPIDAGLILMAAPLCTPAWVTVNVLPATLSVAVRERLPVFDATE